jgi:hypothetical protein
MASFDWTGHCARLDTHSPMTLPVPPDFEHNNKLVGGQSGHGGHSMRIRVAFVRAVGSVTGGLKLCASVMGQSMRTCRRPRFVHATAHKMRVRGRSKDVHTRTVRGCAYGVTASLTFQGMRILARSQNAHTRPPPVSQPGAEHVRQADYCGLPGCDSCRPGANYQELGLPYHGQFGL